MAGARKYWFAAKRYGWGWGPPMSWQGWVVLVVWIAVLVAGMLRFEPASAIQLVFILGMIALLLGVCYAKGEPPRWRWGGRP